MKLSLVIELIGIRKNYEIGGNVVHALKGIDMAMEEGEIIAIMGNSGAGKTTLMNIIGLLDQPSVGVYRLDGLKVETLSDDERSIIRNHKIGFVFQGFFLLPRLNAVENVTLPLLYRDIKPESTHEPAYEVLERVGISHLAHHKPNQLSGGQQQRVAIARALVGNPAVILADEPTGALDTKTGQGVMDLFLRLNSDDKVSVIIVTHDPGVAAQCQRTFHIVDGKIVS